jgi:hypothetical protein
MDGKMILWSALLKQQGRDDEDSSTRATAGQQGRDDEDKDNSTASGGESSAPRAGRRQGNRKGTQKKKQKGRKNRGTNPTPPQKNCDTFEEKRLLFDAIYADPRDDIFRDEKYTRYSRDEKHASPPAAAGSPARAAASDEAAATRASLAAHRDAADCSTRTGSPVDLRRADQRIILPYK